MSVLVTSHCSDMIMSEGGSSLSGSFQSDERRGDPLLLWFRMTLVLLWGNDTNRGGEMESKGEDSPSITVL